MEKNHQVQKVPGGWGTFSKWRLPCQHFFWVFHLGCAPAAFFRKKKGNFLKNIERNAVPSTSKTLLRLWARLIADGRVWSRGSPFVCKFWSNFKRLFAVAGCFFWILEPRHWFKHAEVLLRGLATSQAAAGVWLIITLAIPPGHVF